MNDNCTRCPLCNRPVQLNRHGRMRPHWASLSKVGAGFHGLAQRCPGGNKKPEDAK